MPRLAVQDMYELVQASLVGIMADPTTAGSNVFNQKNRQVLLA